MKVKMYPFIKFNPSSGFDEVYMRFSYEWNDEFDDDEPSDVNTLPEPREVLLYRNWDVNEVDEHFETSLKEALDLAGQNPDDDDMVIIVKAIVESFPHRG